MNSSSRAISLAIWLVNMAWGDMAKRWWRMCSAILSFFAWEIWGMFLVGCFSLIILVLPSQ